MSYRSLFFGLSTLFFSWPALVGAQQLSPLNYQISSSVSQPESNVYLIAEADTHVPSFYQGRPEPTTDNPLSLVAITDLSDTTGLSYQWKVGSDSYRTTTPRLTVIAPNQDKVLVTVNVLDTNNKVLARTNEYITISKPFVVFYEHNPLRAQSRVAIGDSYTLIGDEATIYAEPYFIGSKKNTVTNWTIDGGRTSVPAPFQLTILRPDNLTKTEVPVLLNTYNTDRLSERIEASFNLNFGI